MKRTMIVAAALMFTGITSLTFAHDGTNPSGQTSSPTASSGSTKPAVHHKTKGHHVTKPNKQTSMKTSQPVAKATHKSGKPVASTGVESTHNAMLSSQSAASTSVTPSKMTPTSMNEKKSEPVAENKPAATLTDAAKATTNTSMDHAKNAATESVKSAVPTPSLPTSPAPAAAKTAVIPSSPSSSSLPAAIPAPAVMPTK